MVILNFWKKSSKITPYKKTAYIPKSHKFGEFGYLKKNGIVHKTLKNKKGKVV